LFSLELIGQLVFERLMETHWIVKGFDLLEHRYFGVIEQVICDVLSRSWNDSVLRQATCKSRFC
jgi:hypothetical protein